MNLIFGYDVMTYNGEQPNCLHPKFLSTIHKASDFYFSHSLEFYQKRWNTHWVLYNSNMYNFKNKDKNYCKVSIIAFGFWNKNKLEILSY